MTTRHDQLFAALTIARQNHRKDPSEANFRAIAAARVPMLEFNTIKNKLEDELFDAKRSGNAAMQAELEARLLAHNKPHDDRAAVKLVDAAGTLRLDLNDRRLRPAGSRGRAAGMSTPKLSRPYACQWTTGIERLNVGPSERHTLAVRMAVGPGVVGSVHLDAKNAGDLLADLAVCMPQRKSPWNCLYDGGADSLEISRCDDDVRLAVNSVRSGVMNSIYMTREDARALAIELLRLSNG